MLATVAGQRAMFCHVACRDAFAADRRAGLMYPARWDALTQRWWSHEECSIDTHVCAYCGARVHAGGK